uniref:Uncharacterized protein n=1 Tax=Rhizophora mucronata TaxID=61149 RepID=A0A2P2K3J6_RHIMU
MRIFAWFNSIG